MEVQTATTADSNSSISDEHFRRQFLFVPGVCNRNSRSSHSHVQIEYRRQQRWQKTREWHSGKPVPKGWIHLTRLPTRSNLSDPSIAPSTKSTRPVPGRSVPTASKPGCDEEPVLPENSAKVPVPNLTRVCSKTRQSQHSLLAQTERHVTSFDPFGSFPVTLNRERMALVHRCKPKFCASSLSLPQHNLTRKFSTVLHVVPSMLYHLDINAPFVYQRNLFLPLAMGNPLLFKILLAFSSGCKDAISGQGISRQTIFYQVEGIRGIVKAIQDPKQRYEDTTLAAVAGAAVVAHLEPHTPGFESHARGLAQILSQRGGYESMRDNRLLDFYVTVSAIAISRAQVLTLGQSASKCRTDITVELDELKQARDDLVCWLQGLTLWAESLSSYVAEEALHAYTREAVCDIDASLLALLRSPKALTDPESQQHYVEGSYRLFCLLYLAVALWEYRESPSMSAEFLHRLSSQVREIKIRDVYTTSALVWALVRGVDHRPERKWLVLRMLKALHRLRAETRSLVSDFFFGLFDPTASTKYLSDAEIRNIGEEVVMGLARCVQSRVQSIPAT
jgi:hypothetical protein